MWSFVAKKPKNWNPLNPADDPKGDWWDHVASDPEHRLIRAVVPGARSIENAEAIGAEIKDRTGPKPPRLITSDEDPAYQSALEVVFGTPTPPACGPGRPPILRQRQLPEKLSSATVPNEREQEGVGAVERRLVAGTEPQLEAAWAASSVSRTVNISFGAPQHGTDRGRNARKTRRTDRFSTDWRGHEAMTSLTLYRDNFGWVVRTLRQQDDQGRWQQRTSAMAAGLSDQFGPPAKG